MIRQIGSSIQLRALQLQASSRQMLPYWIGAALTALIAVIFARMFGEAEELSLHWMREKPNWGWFILPATLLISAEMARRWAPGAAGSGIPQLIAALETSTNDKAKKFLNGLLGIRTIFVKFFGTCICILGGGITGREGPMLQIAAGTFYLIQKYWPQKLFPVALKPQSMILAGGAAGLAAAFNTPLGGIIFAIEELANEHISVVRTAVFHSVIIAGLLAQAFLGNYLYFGSISEVNASFSETWLLLPAAAIIGSAGAFFGLAAFRILRWRSRLSVSNQVAMTLLCGLGIAFLLWWTGSQTMGSGRSIIVELLTHPDAPASWSLGLVRGLGNFLTYIGGVVGGIFAPALSTGAAMGSWFGQWSPTANPHLWTLVGMTAFLTGVTRTPFTSLILVIEMSDTHSAIFQLMVGAMAAQGAAKWIDPVSFYEHTARFLISKNPDALQSSRESHTARLESSS